MSLHGRGRDGQMADRNCLASKDSDRMSNLVATADQCLYCLRIVRRYFRGSKGASSPSKVRNCLVELGWVLGRRADKAPKKRE